METLETIARAGTPQGRVALRRRGDAIELIVNGVFAMDSREVTSEIALADAAPLGRVLVGEPGAGLHGCPPARPGHAPHLDVVELAEPLIAWARAGVTEQLGRVASDQRVTLHAGDIADWIRSQPGPWDGILLDVDNGPSFLIHDHNERVYSAELLATFLARLAQGGVLLIWCEEPSPELLATLSRLVAEASEIIVPIEREGRRFDYALYRASVLSPIPRAGRVRRSAATRAGSDSRTDVSITYTF